MNRPGFAIDRPGTIRVSADSPEAAHQARAAWTEAGLHGPAPTGFASRLIGLEQVGRLADAFRRIGRPGTAGDLELVAAQARDLVRTELRGFVGRNGLGEWCFFTSARAEGIPLVGVAKVAAEDALAWSLPTHMLP